MNGRQVVKCSVVVLLVVVLLLDQAAGLQQHHQKKKKRGIYHGLHGYGALPVAAGAGVLPLHHGAATVGGAHFHKAFHHPSPYARIPGFHRSFAGAASYLPPGYALFPGTASVASYQRNFPRFSPTVYGANPLLGFGLSPIAKPLGAGGFASAGLAPIAPSPVYPAPAPVPTPAVYPQPFYPLATGSASAGAASNTQQTQFFATFPQKPIIPVAVPVPVPAQEPAKIPVVGFQKPIYTPFSTVVPGSGLIPVNYNPAVAVPSGQPQFVGVPVGVTGSASGVTPTYATTLSTGTTVTAAPQQPWRPVVVQQPAPTPAPPSNAYLPSYATSQGQIYVSSTPAPPSHHDQQQQQYHHQSLLDIDQDTLHHQQDGSGAFNGQPYDVASNHGRYTGPSSYDVDITHNGYQKKKK
ncbi:calphotin-like [Anopheles darlingi]|uniref:calphotin-like n=1 Tax=Anopheles darlingi TaxID=43151 RepID=UPI0020FFFFF9|nr:calphotin-like [Anopheles darlingi]